MAQWDTAHCYNRLVFQSLLYKSTGSN